MRRRSPRRAPIGCRLPKARARRLLEVGLSATHAPGRTKTNSVPRRWAVRPTIASTHPTAIAVAGAGRSAPRAFATTRTRSSPWASTCRSKATTGATRGPWSSGSTALGQRRLSSSTKARSKSKTSGARVPTRPRSESRRALELPRPDLQFETLKLAPAMPKPSHAPRDVDGKEDPRQGRGQLSDPRATDANGARELEPDAFAADGKPQNDGRGCRSGQVCRLGRDACRRQRSSGPGGLVACRQEKTARSKGTGAGPVGRIAASLTACGAL